MHWQRVGGSRCGPLAFLTADSQPVRASCRCAAEQSVNGPCAVLEVRCTSTLGSTACSLHEVQRRKSVPNYTVVRWTCGEAEIHSSTIMEALQNIRTRVDCAH